MIFPLLCVILIIVAYSFIPRKLSYTMTSSVLWPDKSNNRSGHDYYYYVRDEAQLFFLLCENEPFDSNSVSEISRNLDFASFNYIIVLNKRLKSLSYSPYLTWSSTCYRAVDYIPLIPKYSERNIDSVFIYSVRSNKKFGHTCQ